MNFFATVARTKWRIIAPLAVLLMLLPVRAHAHGELHIRIATLTRKIMHATNNPAALYLQRGELYRQDRSWPEAEADYARAEQLDSTLPGVELCRGKMFLDSDRLAEARAAFGRVLTLSPNDADALIGRARVHLKLRHKSEAVIDYSRGLEQSTNAQPENYLELAQAQFSLQNTNAALSTLDAAIRRFGSLEPLQLAALEIEEARKNYDNALGRVESLARNAARKESWFTRRGDIQFSAGRDADARESFESALRAIKQLPLVLQNAPPLQKLQAHIHDQLLRLSSGKANEHLAAH